MARFSDKQKRAFLGRSSVCVGEQREPGEQTSKPGSLGMDQDSGDSDVCLSPVPRQLCDPRPSACVPQSPLYPADYPQRHWQDTLRRMQSFEWMHQEPHEYEAARCGVRLG